MRTTTWPWICRARCGRQCWRGLSGARVVYGAAEPRESPASMWYTRRVVARGRHVIEQNLSVAGRWLRAGEVGCTACRISELDPQVGADARSETARGTWRPRICHSESWRGLGREAMAGGTLWRSGAQAGSAGVCSIVNYGPGEEELVRAVLAASEGTAQANELTVTELIALTRRARHFNWRRHGAAASGGGVAGSGGGDFWADGSSSQWALWDTEYRVS